MDISKLNHNLTPKKNKTHISTQKSSSIKIPSNPLAKKIKTMKEKGLTIARFIRMIFIAFQNLSCMD